MLVNTAKLTLNKKNSNDNDYFTIWYIIQAVLKLCFIPRD